MNPEFLVNLALVSGEYDYSGKFNKSCAYDVFDDSGEESDDSGESGDCGE